MNIKKNQLKISISINTFNIKFKKKRLQYEVRNTSFFRKRSIFFFYRISHYIHLYLFDT